MSLDRKFLEAQMLYEKIIADLEAKLAESKNKLNQYLYKNDVIEEQYEDLKDGIKFRVENNITDDWEQLYHCIDVLCEKHKARIRDIENGIRKIEELEKLLNAKEKMKTQSLKGFEKLKQQLAEKDQIIENLQTTYQSVMQTCGNDANEIKRLREQLYKQESTITNLIEDNRASQEWYKMQLADTEAQNKRVLEKLDLIVRSNQELEQQLAEKDKLINNYADDLEKVANENADLVFKLSEKEKEYKEGVEKILSSRDKLVLEYNQDKISFAVAELEKLKHSIWTDQQDDGWLDEHVDIYFLTETIDNQIKKLTHQHEDKGEN